MKFKSLIYRLLSISNDLTAIRKGPKAIGRRIGRKAVGRLAGRMMRKI
jgi:hypothetical protein